MSNGAAHAPARPAHQQDAELFRLLVDRVADYAIFLLTPDGHIASWNAGAQRVKGYLPAEIIGQSFERFYTPEARAAGLPQRLLAIARDEGRVEDEGWRVRKDGSRFWADVVITALRDDSGRLLGFAKVTRDLTDRRATEEQLRQSEERFRTLLGSIKDYAIFQLSPEGIVLTWNDGAQLLKGYTPQEIIGQSFERFYTAADRLDGLPRRLLGQARNQGRAEVEGWRVRKDGSLFWADVVITALRDDAGDLMGYVKVTRDLTERRRVEEERTRRLAAERTAERIERLQTATAALAATTRQQHIAEVLLDAAFNALGASDGAVWFVSEDGQRRELTYQRGNPSLDGDAVSGVWESSHPLFSASCVLLPMSCEGHPTALLGVSLDPPRELDMDEHGFLLALVEVGVQAIDRARLFESEERARAEAEAAVAAQDEFLSIASHELRTPVAAVKATAQLAQRAIQRGHYDPHKTSIYLEGIARAADRLASLIDDLLDISRLRTGRLRLRPEPIDILALVREIVDRYTATSPGHHFEFDAGADEFRIVADPLRVEQIMDNLLSNAVKYSPKGGDIAVRLQPVDAGVSLSVTDQGIGLPAGQEERIFETFGRASNAAAEQVPGLGLGLAVSRQLVEAHGGRIWATSPGEQQGTTLAVWLPAGDGDE